MYALALRIKTGKWLSVKNFLNVADFFLYLAFGLICTAFVALVGISRDVVGSSLLELSLQLFLRALDFVLCACFHNNLDWG